MELMDLSNQMPVWVHGGANTMTVKNIFFAKHFIAANLPVPLNQPGFTLYLDSFLVIGGDASARRPRQPHGHSLLQVGLKI